MKDVSALDFATMLNALAQSNAFPTALSNMVPILVLQTHASAVLFTPDRVYKVKKPKNFGFFDYSTPALRRHFCQKEVRLNRELAPHIYLGVAPVLAFADGHVRFGATYAPNDVPIPGDPLEGGQVVDYEIVMVRLPDEATLESQVQEGIATSALLAEIGRYVATFHTTTATSERIASFGSLDVVRGNWAENFEQALFNFEKALKLYHQQLQPLGVTEMRTACASIFLLYGSLHVAIQQENACTGGTCDEQSEHTAPKEDVFAPVCCKCWI